MKTLKKLQITAILLFVVIIILASFFGVFKKEDFRVVDIIKKYKLGMSFTDKVVITGEVKKDENKTIYDSEGNIVEDDGETEYTEEDGYKIVTTPLYNEEDFTEKNYTLTKKILEKRLKKMDAGEFNISLNKETGEIKITLQDNDDTAEMEEHLEQKGEFSIVDKETEEVLIDKDKVKSAKVVYGASKSDTKATVVYLQVNFNKEGAAKLEEISKIYVKDETADETIQEDADETSEATDNTKYISVKLDDETLSSTYFGETMATGVLYVPVTQASDQATLVQYVKEVSKIATVINNGVLPLDYDFNSETVTIENPLNKNLIIGISITAGLLLLACIDLIVKYKVKGLVDTFLQIGYIALVLLAIRYANVVITIGGIVGIGIFAIINYIFNRMLLKDINENSKINWKTVGKFSTYTAPIYVIAVVLVFNKLTKINSVGMSMVWGIICLYIFNLTITKAVLEMITDK